jgi:hypothetical protein
MSTQEATGTHWIDAARYALEHGFVMVEPDGSWHPPTEADWRALDYSEVDECLGTRPTAPTGVVLDTFTASMLVQVYDGLSEANRQKFGAMDVLRAVDIGWKTIRKAS